VFCKTCQYPLWNLKERTCPECGSGYAPSQFRFAPNSIQFLCPHCSQQYYGTSQTGHLLPPKFECVKCAHHIEMDQMVLIPAAGIDERRTQARVNPWTDRLTRPKFRDWLKTTLMSMGAPGALILATDPGVKRSRTLAYAGLTAALTSALSIVMPFLVLAPLLVPLGINAQGVMAIAVWVLGVLLTGVMMYVFVPFYALVAHAVLRGGKPRAGFRMTMHAVSLSSGANIFWGVPVFGMMAGFVGLIWWGISLSVMLRVVHKVGRVRATIAGMLVPAMIFLVAIAGIVALMLFSFRMASTAMTTMSSSAATELAKISRASRMAFVEDGRERHLGSMILEGDLPVADVIGDMLSQTSQAVVGGVDLTPLIVSGTEQERAALAESFDALLTPDLIAYRVGDIIVIRDVPDPSPDPNLWRFALSLEPVANAVWYQQNVQVSAGPFMTTGMGGSDNTSINPDVTQQNAIRASHGLPPLPPLHTITDAAPFRVTDSALPDAPESQPEAPETPDGPG
jgi:hypothetical protein